MRNSIIWNFTKEYIMEKQKHEVRIVLRDWSKTKKANAPVAEKKEVYHDKRSPYHSGKP